MWSLIVFLAIFLRLQGLDAKHIAGWHERRFTNSSRRVDASLRPSSISSTTTALGDYIAAGLDNAPPTSTEASSTSASSSKQPATTARSFRPSSGLILGSRNSTAVIPSGSVYRSSATGPLPWDNATIVDQCWTQWTQYWESSHNASIAWATLTTTYTGALTTGIFASTTYPLTTTVTQMNGNFPTKTFVTIKTVTTADFEIISTGTGVVTDLDVTQGAGVTTITPPPCALPSIVSQCQSSWDDYDGDTYDAPPCTQASVSSSACQSLRDASFGDLFAGGEFQYEISGKPGLKFSTITANGTTTTSGYWPTTSQIAPGCTVGCMSCRISGSNVQLLYWPPATSTIGNGTWSGAATGIRNGTVSAAATQGSGIVTAVTNGFTMTSPTVYVSFDRLYASDSCSVLGSTITNTIIAITNTATLSSLYGWGAHYAQLGAMNTASFNFTDLYVTPVPDSIYKSQPRCASSSQVAQYSCLQWGTTGPPICSTALSNGLVCERSLPYEPVLSIPPEVRNLQPEWANCIGGLDGVYDPPSALSQAISAAAITEPVGPGSTTAHTTSPEPLDSGTAAAPGPTTLAAISPTQAAVSSKPTEPASSLDSPNSQDTSSTELLQSGSLHVTAPGSSSTNALDVLTQWQASVSSSLDASQPSSESSQVGGDTTESGGAPTTTALSAGGAAFTVSGQIISLGSSAIVVDGSSVAFSQPAVISEQSSAAAAVLTVGSSTLTIQQGQPVVVGSSTLTAGGAAVTIGSQAVSLASSGVIVDGSSVQFSRAPASETNTPAAIFTLGSSTISANEGQPIVIGSSTISLGNDPVVIGTQTISVGSSGIVIDGSSVGFTQPFSFEPEETTASPVAVVTIGSDTVTATQNQPIVIGSTTLSAGGEPATINGQTISVGSSGVIVNGQSAGFTQLPSTSSEAPIAVFTIGSQTITAHQGQPLTFTQDAAPSSDAAAIPIAISAATSGPAAVFTGQDHATNVAVQVGSEIVVINPTTTAVLESGEGVVIGSETISFGSGGLVAGSSTLTSLLSVAAPQVTAWTNADGDAYTAIEQASGIVIAGPKSTITLADGSATTIAGETISALSDGSGVLMNGTTIQLPESTETSSVSLPAITRLGGSSSTTTIPGGSSSAPATNSTSKGSSTRVWWLLWLSLTCTVFRIWDAI